MENDLSLAARTEVLRYQRDHRRARILGWLTKGLSLGFFGWLIVVIMVEKRLDVACLSLQGLAIVSGATRVMIAYWDQVPALIYRLRDGTPEEQTACRAAYAELAPLLARRLWELSPKPEPNTHLSADQAVALLTQSRRTDWRRVGPWWLGIYTALVLSVVTWFLTWQPEPTYWP